ncbi:hypothetical protein PTKIN_Ptkin11bG0055500 [Pterospermum kingtungense]
MTFDERLRLILNNASTLEFLKIWIEHKEVDLYVCHKVEEAILLEEPLVLSGPPVESSQPVESSSRVNDTVGGSAAVGGINESNIDVGQETDDEVEKKEEQVCETEGVGTVETEHIVILSYNHFGKNLGNTRVGEKGFQKSKVLLVPVEDAEGDPDPLKNVRKRKKTELEASDSDNGYRTEHYYDTDDALSLEGTDSDGENAATRKSRFPQHKSDQVVSEFCVGMVFKDGTDFKAAVRRYSVYVKRELKIVKNEPK